MINGGLDKMPMVVLECSQKEAKLIERIRKLPYGEFDIKIVVRRNEPVRLEIKPCESEIL